MPSLQQLRYLVAVADTLHFSRAAESVNVTQPTLSMQIKEMEARLGVQLLERSRARVVLTPVGSEIALRARRVLRDVEEIREIARLSQQPLGGTVRVGVVQSLGSYFLPLVLPELHETHPTLRLYVREALPAALLDQLDGGALDLLFYPLPIERRDFDTMALFREPLLVVMPRDHPLASANVVHPGDLRGETFLTLEPGHRLYDQVRRLCDDFGATVSHDFEGTSLDTLRQMVAMGTGLSLLPSLYVRSEVARENLVVALPFAESPPSRYIGMVWRRGSPREAEFRDLGQLIIRTLRTKAPDLPI